MILAQTVMVLKRFTNKHNNSSWKITLNYFLSQVRKEFILKCNFDTRQLPIYLPAFYKECLDAWSMLRQPLILSYEDVVHQVIWNKKKHYCPKDLTFRKTLVFPRNCYDRSSHFWHWNLHEGCQGVTCKFISDKAF